MVLLPQNAGAFIAKHAKSVKMLEMGIDRLASDILNGINDGSLDINNFSQNSFHPKSDDIHAINWIFVVDTLNFCFWTAGAKPKWCVEKQTGYFALCAAINRAIREGINITNPKTCTKLTIEELKHILRSDDGVTCAPLIEERLECLHEVGSKLLQKYNGDFTNCIKASEKSAGKLLQLIVTEFPCFRDEAEYQGEQVAIYKRAQILIGDIWACFRGKQLGEFKDIEMVTMFADYRVPQVLIHYGCMEYTPELMKILKEDKLLKNGSEEEVEIRGVSIHIVEVLKSKLLKAVNDMKLNIDTKMINSILLDHYLWDYRRKHAADLEYIPFHKVLCIYY